MEGGIAMAILPFFSGGDSGGPVVFFAGSATASHLSGKGGLTANP
jgi:hypothetical protein